MCIRDRLTPSVLSKRLVKYAEVLEQNGIRVVSERTRTTPTLSILCMPCDGSDGSEGKNCYGACVEFAVTPVTAVTERKCTDF